MQYRAEATSLDRLRPADCLLLPATRLLVLCDRPRSGPQRRTSHRPRLIEKYGIGVSESTRARRKRLGQANLQYLRLGRTFVILATKGQHKFFEAEFKSIHDIRHTPLKIGGYSISYRRGGRTRSGDRDRPLACSCRNRTSSVSGTQSMAARTGSPSIGGESRSGLLRNPLRTLRSGPSPVAEHSASGQSVTKAIRIQSNPCRSRTTSTSDCPAV